MQSQRSLGITRSGQLGFTEMQVDRNIHSVRPNHSTATMDSGPDELIGRLKGPWKEKRYGKY